MRIRVQTFRAFAFSCRQLCATTMLGSLVILGLAQSALAQAGTNPLNIFKNYFVTGDYVVGGWVEGLPDGSGYAPGTITIPDPKQQPFLQRGVPSTVPKGAEIVAAYLYWGTVESNQSSLAGQQAFFNGYAISGAILGNLNAPVSWSSGGCSGSAQGSKTMRTYRADVRPYMPLDTNSTSPTFGALVGNGSIRVRLADSGSNGNATPFALGATLVVIYRVLSPPLPLNAIVLYDGSYAPNNSAQTVVQKLAGFYQPAISSVAKLTHIVANGQPNKSEQVYLNNTSQPLNSIYGSQPPFPGVYGNWDNPTWNLSPIPGYVQNTDTWETTSVVPSSSNSGCVSWGAMVLSTTVQDTDGDGLLDVWETGNNPGYTDAVSSQWVALPGANPNVKDLFIEADYLSNLDGSSGTYLHSHLPKQAALDAVAATFSAQNINVHFDLGPGIYQGDPNVITYPVPTPNPLPAGTLAPQAGTGGNAISEGSVLCTDGTTLCAFPGQPAIAWKGGLAFLQNQPTQGNFQPGRSQSYHYALFGHSLGDARSFWSTVGSQLSDPTISQLVSIVNSGSSATVTIQSPKGVTKPGDCSTSTPPAGCSDASSSRVTISGVLGQPSLNGTYFFNNPVSASGSNNTIITTFTITTASVASGTYTFANEPQLGVAYLGPTSTSGHSDFGGGGDLAVTLGLWGADDPANCQPDPSQLVSGQVSCNNQVGTVPVQTGTLLHELGHTLTLTHGGTYYNDPNNPGVPTYEVNCKPNFVSTMNYLFQVRGFVDGGSDYSGQTIVPLNEASLNESTGIGLDFYTGQQSAHLTRWYSAPNALDTQLQNTTGGRYAKSHCDGSPLTSTDVAAVRVEGSAPVGQFSGPLDWNNDLTAGDAVVAPGVDVNYNGITGDAPFSGFNDWQAINLQQMSGRASAFGFSDAGGIKTFGGGIKTFGGGVDDDGGGVKTFGGGIKTFGGGIKTFGGGVEQDEDTANSTATPTTGLTCSIGQNKVPGCVSSSSGSVENGKSVPLTWTAPNFGQVRTYYVWRAVGSFPTTQAVLSNIKLFTNIKTLTGTPPPTSYVDSSVKNTTTYTYFVTDANKQGAQSSPSNSIVVTTKF